METLFKDSKLKVKRANQHINELQHVLNAFLKTDFYRLSVEKEPKGGRNILKFEDIKEIPCEVPLIIGDAIHNLRAALDLMACEIITRAGETPDRFTKFPFYKTRQELVGAINGGKIKAAHPTIIDLIVDTIKPYKGGNDPLCALDNLDIIDKHRLLIPIISITSLVGVYFETEAGARFNNSTLIVGQGGVLNAVAADSNIKITNQGHPAFDVIFDRGQVFEGKSVIPTLHQLSQLVSGIVQTVENAYLALGKGTI